MATWFYGSLERLGFSCCTAMDISSEIMASWESVYKHYSSDPMTPSSFTWQFKLILKKNGLPEKLNVHSLRHSNASLLIANGTDVATVAGLLGHSQPSTTLDIYTHAFDKNKKAASEALQQGLEI